MIKSSEYPENWAKIADAVKQAAGYRCNNCELKCLPPTDSYKHLDLSLRRRLSAQVHHIEACAPSSAVETPVTAIALTSSACVVGAIYGCTAIALSRLLDSYH